MPHKTWDQPTHKLNHNSHSAKILTCHTDKKRTASVTLIEGSLQVKLPTMWPDEKQRWVESEKRREAKRKEEKRSEEKRREEKRRRKKIKKRKSPKKENPGARKGRTSATHCVFPMVCGSGRSKKRLAKAAGAEPAGQMRDEKLHTVVARSTCPSQKCKKLTGSGHIWKLGCRKSARRCGAKHISKSKCTKQLSSGALLEVEMSKKCTPMQREAHFQVKSVKN